MKIEKLRVKNFGCLRDVAIDFAPLTVLVGPNDSGKTMVLRAIEQICLGSTAKVGWADVYPSHAEFSESTFGGGGGEQEFGFDGTLAGVVCSYRVKIGMKTLPVPEVLSETLSFTGSNLSKAEIASGSHGHIGVSVGTENCRALRTGGPAIPFLSQNSIVSFAQDPVGTLLSAHQTLVKMTHAIPGLRRFRLSPSSLREPVPREEELPEPPRIREDGWGLPGAFADLFLKYRDAANAMEKGLHEGLPGVRRLNVETPPEEVITRGSLRPRKVYDLSLETTLGSKVSSAYISDGVVLYLAYLLLIMGPSSQTVLMIEEPETGIHPGLLEKLVRALRGLSEGANGMPPVQVVLTTHSPLLLNLVRPHEIRIVARGTDGGTNVTPFTSAPDLNRLLEFQGPGELWVNMGEDYIRNVKSSG